MQLHLTLLTTNIHKITKLKITEILLHLFKQPEFTQTVSKKIFFLVKKQLQNTRVIFNSQKLLRFIEVVNKSFFPFFFFFDELWLLPVKARKIIILDMQEISEIFIEIQTPYSYGFKF